MGSIRPGRGRADDLLVRGGMPRSSPELRSTFVGHAEDVAAVTAAVQDPPAIALVAGEPGIGKTRLVQECLSTTALGAHTVVASCPPLPEPFPRLPPPSAGLPAGPHDDAPPRRAATAGRRGDANAHRSHGRYPSVSAEFAEFLHAHAGGVPLAIEECLRLLRDRQDIVERGGRWVRRILAELRVPPTIRDSVLERVSRLPAPTQATLDAAAVLAEPADEQTLAAVAALDEDSVRSALAAALASGLLREADPGRYTFRHVLDAQSVGEAIPVTERRRLHRRAAEHLQLLDPPPVVRLRRHVTGRTSPCGRC